MCVSVCVRKLAELACSVVLSDPQKCVKACLLLLKNIDPDQY